MSESEGGGEASIVSIEDLGTGDAALWRYWMGEYDISSHDVDPFHTRGKKIVRRYRDERTAEVKRRGSNQFNILWSNVQTLMPALYGRTPKPDVQRRWLDQDDTGRLSSILLERCISYTIERNFDRVMKAVVQDRLLPGLGVARVVYKPLFGNALPPEEGQDTDKEPDPDEPPLREVVNELILIEYIYWQDYREGAARTWETVPWISYGVNMTRAEMIARFGKKKAMTVSLDVSPNGLKKVSMPPDMFKRARVHEIWDKTNREVIWLAPGTPDLILDKKPDPLGLPEFYPGPDPLLATTTTDMRIPVPDFAEYQDQADELDDLTARIGVLLQALKVAGVYPGDQQHALETLLSPGGANKLVAIPDWAQFMDRGGAKDLIQYLPIKEIAETIIQLYAARDRTKATLYEITGIGDIMRGQTSPNETLGAQELKANFSTRRLVPQQKDVARFASDLIRIVGAVVSEQFSPQTISMITGYPQLAPVPPRPPQPQPVIMGTDGQMQPNPEMGQWQQAMAAAQQVMQENQKKQQQFDAACKMIRDDGLTGYKLDIEADSTIAPDEQAEKMARVEFLQQMIPLLQQIVPLAMGNPPLAKMAAETALFAMRGFRVARTLEETYEQGFAAIAQMPPMPQKGASSGQPADPAIEHAKIQAQMQDTQMKTQASQQETQLKAQAASQDNQTKLTIAQMQIGQKSQEAAMEAQNAHVRAQAEHEHNMTMAAIAAEKNANDSRIADARVAKMAARGAEALT